MPIFDDRSTRPISPEDRERLAEAWLKNSGEFHGGPVDILAVLTSASVQLVEWSAEKMGADEARAYPQVRTITARSQFVSAARRGDPTTLIKIAHEFSHCVINDGPGAKPLKLSGNAKLSWISDNESEENLAWQLARAIMMPRAFIKCGDCADALTERFRVPVDHASIRLAELQLERRKNLQNITEPTKPALPSNVERAWQRAAIAEDHDAEWYRLSNGKFLVALIGHEKRNHKLGWFLHNDRIYSYEENDPLWWCP